MIELKLVNGKVVLSHIGPSSLELDLEIPQKLLEALLDGVLDTLSVPSDKLDKLATDSENLALGLEDEYYEDITLLKVHKGSV